jgi:hypothetical protein
MRVCWLLLCVLLSISAALAAEICDPARVVGPYAVQISGTTTISGDPKPTTSLGSIVFDGNGSVSGTTSTMFSGYLLGKPVTGTYDAKLDCSIVWKLQDDSGAFQHFGGTYSADGARAQFKQTDPGGPLDGIMEKTPDTCSAASLKEAYSYTVAGSTTPMQDGDEARTVSAKGTLDVAASGSFQVQSDCSVLFRLTVPGKTPEGEAPFPMNMRGFLVNGGNEILAFQTDPGAMVAARLRAVTK